MTQTYSSIADGSRSFVDWLLSFFGRERPKLVSMCQMNATDLRRRLNLQQQEDQSASA